MNRYYDPIAADARRWRIEKRKHGGRLIATALLAFITGYVLGLLACIFEVFTY